jgi:hypothetical protein
VFVTGRVGGSPFCALSIGAAGVPGVQLTNRSPISDCGAIVQSASAWKGAKSWLITISTRAFRSLVSLMLRTCPALAPAIRTSWPGIRKSTSSKIASTR